MHDMFSNYIVYVDVLQEESIGVSCFHGMWWLSMLYIDRLILVRQRDRT